ncbi:MAG TPA: hypothetical protein VJQ61_06265 [Sinomonas sp.]|nr:hypothetical protein [Sinomonas sp.]
MIGQGCLTPTCTNAAEQEARTYGIAREFSKTLARMLDLRTQTVESCVAVEDTRVGLRSAESAGCAVVVVRSAEAIPPAAGRTIAGSLSTSTLRCLPRSRTVDGPAH